MLIEHWKDQKQNICNVCEDGYLVSKDWLSCEKVQGARSPVAPPDTETPPELQDSAEGSCPWQECCQKEKPPAPQVPIMRPHKHVQNPSVSKGLSTIGNMLTEWYEKMKPKPFRDQPNTVQTDIDEVYHSINNN